MVDRAYRLSSSSEAFSTEYQKLRCMLPKLWDQTKNQLSLTATKNERPPVYFKKILYKDQTSADKFRRELDS